MNKAFKIPLSRGWSLRFSVGTSDMNWHGERLKPGTDYYSRTSKRSTLAVVPLGRGYRERHTWGRQFIVYWRDASWWHFSVVLWDGKHHGYSS